MTSPDRNLSPGERQAVAQGLPPQAPRRLRARAEQAVSNALPPIKATKSQRTRKK